MFGALPASALVAGLRLTCHADDLTFSGAGATPEFLWQAKAHAQRCGFAHVRERSYAAQIKSSSRA
jgi:hypothetical protein